MKPFFANNDKYLIRLYSLDIYYFLETWISEPDLQWVQRFMRPLWNIYMLPSQELSRGIIIARKKSLGQLRFTYLNRQVAFEVMSSNQQHLWIVRVVSSSTCGMEQRELWRQDRAIVELYLPTLFLIGDFNYILDDLDKQDDKPFQLNRNIKEFQNFFGKQDY